MEEGHLLTLIMPTRNIRGEKIYSASIKSIKFEDASQAVVKMHKLWGCIRDVSQDQREIEEHLVVVDEGKPSQLNAEKQQGCQGTLVCSKNDRRNSEGTLRQKFNLIDI